MHSVLVVEDSAMIRQIYWLCLDQSNFSIVGEAKTGFEALALLRSLKPTVVLLDLVLPELSGVEVLQRITDMDSSSRVLVVTSVDDTEALGVHESPGHIKVLKKPFTKVQLLDALTQLAEIDRQELKRHG